MDLSTFGKMLRHYREAAGLSMSKLAKLCDYDHSYISRLESDERLPSRASVMTIADGLGFPEDSAHRASLLWAAGYRTTELPPNLPDELRVFAELFTRATLPEQTFMLGIVRMLIQHMTQNAPTMPEPEPIRLPPSPAATLAAKKRAPEPARTKTHRTPRVVPEQPIQDTIAGLSEIRQTIWGDGL